MMSTTHAHITTWAIAIILFIVALSLHKSGNLKGFKIVQMILRVFYILIIITGILLYPFGNESANHALYGIKVLAGLLVISMFEMILIKISKGKNAGSFWVIFVIALALVLYLGLRLPLGFHPFL
ncbi:YisL family protein [Falsibacillus pallidus]|uniref:UPF0344 protein DFR59_101475 n=1 Tax=Falsibacillus pallidus TaxID=493781 RepID=A0A370GX31_9BACI|nr:YisL family protein [Falsibacillus pallidus]RDI47810.1 uncharacterized protein DUF1516 [Falsibacillus pallidus]